MRTLCLFVSVLMITGVYVMVSSAQDRQMGGVSITPDLRSYNMQNRVSSLRPVGSGGSIPPPTKDWYIVLFDQTNYRGKPTNYNSAVANLSGNSRRAQSVTIGRGVWELCENNNFKGRCITFDTSSPNLPSFLRNHVSSLRPLMRQPR
jgi:Beta/Gamma crystallin